MYQVIKKMTTVIFHVKKQKRVSTLTINIKFQLKEKIDDETISNNHAEGINDFSEYFSINVDYIKYKFGSNYFPAEIMMSMKEEQ